MKTLPYYDKLVKIRSALEKNVSKFPVNGCGEASISVERILGLPQIIREYHGPNNISDPTILVDGDYSTHMLNVDKKRGLYIDLSKDQFNGKEKIVISKINGNKEYKKNTELSGLLKNIYYDENILSKIKKDSL